MSKKKKESKRLESQLLSIFNQNPNKKFNYKQLAGLLKVSDTQGRNTIIRVLGKLKSKGILKQNQNHQYSLQEATSKRSEGIFTILPSGRAFVKIDDSDKEIIIPKRFFLRALHGDRVSINNFKSKNGSSDITAEVVSIIERANNSYVGILERKDQFGFVTSQNARVYTDFFIEKKELKDFKNGDKVVVTLKEWPIGNASPIGTIVKSLGTPGDAETEIHAILHDYGLPYEFPDTVEAIAKSINTNIEKKEINKRRDLRQTLTFTIDPITAKDFDDALSFKQLENGNYEIGIHIADVSHYVKKDSLLDEEAYNRATSVYLVDRVVPMLPEVLSNGLCSLRPNEDKYTFSSIFIINSNAQVIEQWFGKTVINSDHRFSYEEVQFILDSDSVEVSDTVSLSGSSYVIPTPTFDALNTLNSLAKQIRALRMKHGAISFDRVEVNFKLNSENHPESVFFKSSKDAHKLIEEFMLLANRKVAEFIGKITPTVPFVYRVHDVPDAERLSNLQSTIGTFGYQINLQSRNLNKSINNLLKECSGSKEQNLIDTLTLRCMSKAVYTTNNIGHYGLAFDYYTHFTSPIRRYPDILVHRLLENHLNGLNIASKVPLEEACRHSSERELLATKAERDSIKYMQIVFMEDKIGQEFDGVITGLTERSVFVEIIENKCEGMIRLSDIHTDFFIFNERHFTITGKRTKKVYQLGDPVQIIVKKANVLKRHLDFSLV